MKLLIRVVIAFILMTSVAWGETYYIRHDGTNADPDCSESSACCVGAIGNQADLAGASYITDNDIVYICDDGGDLDYPLDFPTSGSVGNLIVYDGHPPGQSVQTIIDIASGYTSAARFNNDDYIELRNITVIDATVGNIYATTGSDGIVINNVLSSSSTGHGIRVEDCSDVEVKNSTITGAAGTGLMFHDSPNLDFHDNTVTGNGTDNDANYDGMEIDGCANYEVYDSTFSSNEGTSGNSGLDINPSATPVESNGTVRGSKFLSNNIAGLTIKGAGDHYIHNNLMYNNVSYQFYFGDNATGGTVYLYNNTLASPATGVNIIRMYDVFDTGATLNMQNNILYGEANYAVYYDGDDSTIVSGYNDFYLTGETAFARAQDTTGNRTFANWVTDFEGGVQTSLDEDTDPLFISATNFHLKSTSPAIGAGADLGSTYSIGLGGNDQYDCRQSDAWDLGALPYCEGGKARYNASGMTGGYSAAGGTIE